MLITMTKATRCNANAGYQRSPGVECSVVVREAEGMIAMLPLERHATKSKKAM